MRSSSAPTRKITPAPSKSPNGSEFAAKMSFKSGSCDATAIAARKPTNIAAPPSVGNARVCTRRGSSDGCTTAPNRTASIRTIGVTASVVPSATAQTIAYEVFRSDLPVRVRRELRAQTVGLLAHVGRNGIVVDVAQDRGDERRDLAHLLGSHTRARARCRTEPQTAC